MTPATLCNLLDDKDAELTKKRNELIAKANRLHMARQRLRAYEVPT